jgi:hypothetical protein
VTEIRVSERRENPLLAREVAMQCQDCGKWCFGLRSHMRAAMEEHRRLHHQPETDTQIMRIIYPRA